MKNLLPLLLLLSCQKDIEPKQTILHEMYISNMCFDSINYNVEYKFSGVKPSYKLYGGCIYNGDTLSQIKLSSVDGFGSFVAGTDGRGCGVKVYIGAVTLDGEQKLVVEQGNCNICK